MPKYKIDRLFISIPFENHEFVSDDRGLEKYELEAAIALEAIQVLKTQACSEWNASFERARKGESKLQLDVTCQGINEIPDSWDVTLRARYMLTFEMEVEAASSVDDAIRQAREQLELVDDDLLSEATMVEFDEFDEATAEPQPE